MQDTLLFCESYGVRLPEDAAARLARFAQRLAEANQVMNLTRVDTPEGIASRHLADSLVFCACLQEREEARILDLGTGPGLPAIPLAIARPRWRITALDATSKKIAFVARMAEELGLPNLTPIAERAEVLGHQPGHREGYHAVVARAVANLPVLLEYAVPFLKPSGFLFAPKGSRADDEIRDASRAFEELGASLVSQEEYPTPDPEVRYSMLVIQKVAPTRPVYPRHPSRIRSRPLGPVPV